MSRTDELPPDQRAALSLLLSQRKSYAEVATLLQIPPGAVHDRAQAALAVLAPGEARKLTPEERAEVGDYLLGQSGIADRLKIRTYLSDSEPAHNWALAVAGELSALTRPTRFRRSPLSPTTSTSRRTTSPRHRRPSRSPPPRTRLPRRRRHPRARAPSRAPPPAPASAAPWCWPRWSWRWWWR